MILYKVVLPEDEQISQEFIDIADMLTREFMESNISRTFRADGHKLAAKLKILSEISEKYELHKMKAWWDVGYYPDVNDTLRSFYFQILQAATSIKLKVDENVSH